MIAEELNNYENPDISAKTGTTINYIINVISDACVPFKKALSQTNILKPLNENKLTQIFVEQIEVKIKSHQFIGVKNQYSDIHYGTKGIPDFYFHKVEEGIYHEPLFIVESKRLPSPTFETEYVFGNKNNGGIERFKIEKHGLGLFQCGMIGFIEKDNFPFWVKKVNDWINEKSISDTTWYKDEQLRELKTFTESIYLNSIVHRASGDLLLHHFWINN